jgi:hypothetical protein
MFKSVDGDLYPAGCELSRALVDKLNAELVAQVSHGRSPGCLVRGGGVGRNDAPFGKVVGVVEGRGLESSEMIV